MWPLPNTVSAGEYGGFCREIHWLDLESLGGFSTSSLHHHRASQAVLLCRSCENETTQQDVVANEAPE